MLSVLLAPAIPSAPANLSEKQMGAAKVHIVVVDGFGRDLGEANIESFQDADGHELAKRFRQNTAIEIPYRTYSMRVHMTGFWTAEKKVYVFKPDVWIVVGLRVGEELPVFPAPRWVVTGTVRNFDPGEQPIYMRLVGLYTDYLIEDRLDVAGQSGNFTLAGVNPQGKFLLITLGRTRTLDVRQIEIPTKAPIVIELGSTGSPKL